jgi:predicted lactoylglutathione lyase
VFDHVDIRASDRGDSERFYGLVLATLGIEQTHSDDEFVEWGDFGLVQGPPLTRGLHIAFGAPTQEHVHAFWQAGIDAGYRDDGAPGPRPEYGSTYYGGFLLDPDGNSVEAVHHETARERPIDHLWIRVADVEASRRFYETIAPHAGFELKGRGESPRRYQFGNERGSFSVVEGAPTENVHVAFPATENETVDSFHRAATAAGYADNGAPGERPVYHAGYYGAFVLDPDGNNVEVVNHNR